MKKTLKEKADEIVKLVNYIKDTLALDPALGEFIERNYPDVIQSVEQRCLGCGSNEFSKIKKSKEDQIYECSDCPEVKNIQ
jgi:hypothetical protein